MTIKVSYIIYIILGTVLLCSCSTIKLPHGIYKNIGECYKYKLVESDSGIKREYHYKFLPLKKIQGRACYNTNLQNRICAEFTNGLLNGKLYYYEQDKERKNYVLSQERNYHNGVLNGVFYDFYKVYYSKEQREAKITRKGKYQSGYINGFIEIYENGRLVRKAEYKNSIKDGYEYFNSTENYGDTIHYTYDPHYKSFNTVAYIKEKSNFSGSKIYSIDQFEYIKGKFLIDGKLNPSSEYGDYTPLFIFDIHNEFKLKKEHHPMYVIVGRGEPYFDLYMIDFLSIRLGYIKKDHL